MDSTLSHLTARIHTEVDQVKDGFRRPVPEARPMMRWWWFGPDVDHAELERELEAMRDAGIGGVEVAFVYPLREGSPRFLSETMLAALRHAALYARKLGLRFDMTLGSGWSYGGPHIDAQLASRKLHWDRRDISVEPMDVPVAASWPGDELVGAYLGDGFPPESWRWLPHMDGIVRIPEGRGPRTVLLAWSRVTGQQVKRASAGAEGPVLDHLSAAATRRHLEVVGQALLGAVPSELVGSVFSDSLEVYEANWTPSFPAEFERRRGYDPLPSLYLLEVAGTGAEEFRLDVGRTLTELVEDNFVAVCSDWAREHGVPFRLQGYGEPPISMSSSRSADLIEGEGCGWTELTQLRWASSAGHLYGREVISSEAWTWVHSPSFRATPMDLKSEAHEHLLLGSNQLIGHGWPYSPPDVPGMGWYFYAAGALDDRNPWWPAMPHLMEYLTRLSWALRQGQPAADVVVYLPLADVYVRHGGARDLWKACRDHIGAQIPEAIRRSGHDFDVIDDGALETLDPGSVPVVILPAVTRLPEPARDWLDAVRAAGGTVIGVGDCLYPGAVPTTCEAFAETLRRTLPPPLEITGGGGEIGVVRRQLADADLYFVANTGPSVRSVGLTPRAEGSYAERWDPADGSAAPVYTTDGTVRVALAPYEAMLLVLHETAPETDSAHREDTGRRVGSDARTSTGSSVADEATLELDGPWSFSTDGTDGVPVELPHRWDVDAAGPLDRGTYETVVSLDESWASPKARVILDLGPCHPGPSPEPSNGHRVEVAAPMREIAVVEVNGRKTGVLWDAPFHLDITSTLQPGKNTIRLTVHSTAASAVAADEHAEAIIAGAHRAYGVRFEQQDLDRILDGVAAGLLAVPVLRKS